MTARAYVDALRGSTAWTPTEARRRDALVDRGRAARTDEERTEAQAELGQLRRTVGRRIEREQERRLDALTAPVTEEPKSPRPAKRGRPRDSRPAAS
ncbi:MAG: hypothetical protein ABSE49_28010, partial [Polyangiaceae bacterium]